MHQEANARWILKNILEKSILRPHGEALTQVLFTPGSSPAVLCEDRRPRLVIHVQIAAAAKIAQSRIDILRRMNESRDHPKNEKSLYVFLPPPDSLGNCRGDCS